jgi:hypoxanthine phosphoribosyltransferase
MLTKLGHNLSFLRQTMSDLTPDNVMNHAELIYTPKEIDAALETMAQDITKDYSGKNPLCIIVLNGGVVFAGQLLPKLNFPLELDYLHATRYRGALKGSDAMHWLAKPNTSLKGRHVLILDDILDAGVTLAEIMKFCIAHEAQSVKCAVLINKEVAKSPDGVMVPDYYGLSAPDLYLFGYGMDFKESWRNAPGIFAIPA